MKIAKSLDNFNRKISILAAIFLWILVGLTFFLAIALDFSYVNSQLDDLSLYCFALFVLLSISCALRKDRHVRVDLLYIRYSEKTRKKSWFFINLVCILPFSLVLIQYGLDFVIQSYKMGEFSANGKIPHYFVFKSFIVVGFVCLVLQSVSEILKTLTHLKSTETSSNDKTNSSDGML